MRSWILPEFLIVYLYDLEAIVNFTIHADGSISDIRLEKSSGNKTFDTSAVRAIKQAAPFPAFPRTIRKKFIDIGIRFRPEEKLDG
jgi:TonB family protein